MESWFDYLLLTCEGRNDIIKNEHVFDKKGVKKMGMEMIGARVPQPAIGMFIRWCRKKRVSQAEVIRRALAAWIENDPRCTDEDLVLAAILRDTPRRMPRA